MQRPAGNHLVGAVPRRAARTSPCEPSFSAMTQQIFADLEVDERRGGDAFGEQAPGFVGIDDAARCCRESRSGPESKPVPRRAAHRWLRARARASGVRRARRPAAAVACQVTTRNSTTDRVPCASGCAVNGPVPASAPQIASTPKQQHRGGAARHAESRGRPQQHGQRQAQHRRGGDGLEWAERTALRDWRQSGRAPAPCLRPVGNFDESGVVRAAGRRCAPSEGPP